ncbi:hypothetical protein EN836_26135 [Mesorhizobium sp. M1C.F.Ca.ET.193.01.1.1]|uniref:hypothetical protein n=1 Tax=unclassified Mesorhizobium TaxID=325217 RepID=UPI000FD1C09B|nr:MULTISPECIES: hypothetical protein [unclassified Mesorhizobium]TGS93956.1 hypothetical protein EN820_46795 [bacterium M00.F.Ca.ET.177.01.1.1]TGQ51025.1 hypothetical protein EN853_26125 [Mesorhizobium sp. M1C.F.Ca.ET.210.01.1.1]TGQ66456.1 hypothetical protein EN855_026135 [Mesorhizobium sp. M1C.F.Ca.ET.212.01.1.1]TGR00852.1 hypothetical protein EN847_26125 [Mesorhizobium sp. M1C.F.Ca.ET.204.01.1.1]TGR21127.1 hypothetical protein EN839_26125 [Mesorhizobium sp. M1C.F.Ca.ET.196.01.1.1]
MSVLGCKIAGAALLRALWVGTLLVCHAAAQGSSTFTSPIDITGGRITIEAVAPDKDTGVVGAVQSPLVQGMAALARTPINSLFDGRWNGTPDQQAAGASPRQTSCDGPGGIKETIEAKAAKMGHTAFEITCNFATAGSVFVSKAAEGLYVSYQLFNNKGSFKVRNDVADARFSLTFALELTTLIHTGNTICSLRADAPVVLLHGVQIEPENAAASIHDFLNPSDLTKMELDAQAKERTTSISVNDVFQQLQDACNRGDIVSRVIAKFAQLETDISLPQGVTFRAVHPGIAAPRFQNVSLPFGQFTCVAGYVWRNAYEGDVVCVTPQRASQVQDENGLAKSRRDPNGGLYGEATCLAGFVWRVARSDDLVCVPPASRDLIAQENADAASKWVTGSTVPSLTRPSISAPPVVAAGANFNVSGQFFPPVADPTRLKLSFSRDTTSACIGGSSQLEVTKAGQVAAPATLKPSSNMSSCSYSYDVVGLTPSTAYSFRLRDCDYVTCSPWSAPFATTTLGPNNGPGPVAIVLDTGATLGTVAVDAAGGFLTSVRLPAETAPGVHRLTASTGGRGDTIELRVTPAGGETATLMVTIAFFGDVGCPMRELDPPKIAADYTFPLFGSGFSPGKVRIYLDSSNGGLNLGSATVGADGTFCSEFRAIPMDKLGQRNLVAVQGGTERSVLPVEVVYVPSVH